MKTVIAKLGVPDDFERGMCHECELREMCDMFNRLTRNCPLEIQEPLTAESLSLEHREPLTKEQRQKIYDKIQQEKREGCEW